MIRLSHRLLGIWRSLLLAAVLTASSHAASLGVSPTLVDLSSGESASGLRVQNSDAVQPVSVQARILRWQQDEQGDDVYTPTDDVVVSPPVTRIQPGAENLIRIVRVATHPVQGEESYRLLVDQLPDPGQQHSGAVSMLIRHSVPVFFSQDRATPAQAQWRIEPAQQNGERGWRITVQNSGDKRLRLANLRLTDAQGVLAAEQQGLVSYVLGRSSVRLFIPASGSGSSPSATALRLSVQSETETIETTLLPVAKP